MFGGGGFGSQNNNSPFGTPSTPSTSAFGSTTFGTPNTSTFGAKPSGFGSVGTGGGFGSASNTGGSLFGSSPSRFGSNATGSAFGGGGGSVFGAPSVAPATGFGQASSFGSTASTPFGSSSATPFGATTSQSPFGASTSPSPFGSALNSASPFGAPSSTPGFGSNTGGSLFGGGSNTFGSSSFGASPSISAFGATPSASGTSHVQYKATKIDDKSQYGATLSSILGMDNFASKSIYELRAEDYAMGKKSSNSVSGFGGSTFGQSSNTFGSSSFGTPSTGFGASAPSTGFGTPAPTTGFGAAPSTGFGASAPSTGFGASAPSTGFGAPASSTLGGFGTPASNTFGSSLTTTPLFGSTTAPSIFGSTSISAFGSTAPAPSTFGSFDKPNQSLFGSSTTTQSNTFGASQPAASSFGFGSSATPSAFGKPNSFSPAPATTSLFGSSLTPASSSLSFGTPSATAPSSFGTSSSGFNFGNAPTQSGFGGSTFGSSLGAPAASTGFGFGSAQTPAPTPSSAFSFGGSTAPSGNLFGNTTENKTFASSTPSFGSFGTPAPTNPTPGFFGTSTPAPAPGNLFSSSFSSAPTQTSQNLFNQNANSISQTAAATNNYSSTSLALKVQAAELFTKQLEIRMGGENAISDDQKNGIGIFRESSSALPWSTAHTPILPKSAMKAKAFEQKEKESKLPIELPFAKPSEFKVDSSRKLVINTATPALNIPDTIPPIEDVNKVEMLKEKSDIIQRDLGRGEKKEKPKETTETGVSKPSPFAPILTKKDYSTSPPMEQIQTFSHEQLSSVKNFSIIHTNYGKIEWLEPVDLRNQNLDSAVVIDRNTVAVYDEMAEEDKPPIGQYLNKQAKVTLNVPLRPGAKFEDQKKKLENWANRRGVQFIDYNAYGEYSFRTEHFSRYEIDMDDEESEVLEAEKQNGAPTLEGSKVSSMQDLAIMDHVEGDGMLNGFENDEYLMANLKDSLPLKGHAPQPLFRNNAEDEMDTDMIDLSYTVPKNTLKVLGPMKKRLLTHLVDNEQITPPTTITTVRSKWSSKTMRKLDKEHSLRKIDLPLLGYQRGFRACFGVDGTLILPSARKLVHYDYLPGAEKNVYSLTRYKLNTKKDGILDDPIPTIESHIKFSNGMSGSEGDFPPYWHLLSQTKSDDCLLLIHARIEYFEKLYEDKSLLIRSPFWVVLQAWKLLNSLWGCEDRSKTMSVYDDVMRFEAFSIWLKDVLSVCVSERSPCDQNQILRSIDLLSVNKKENACHELQDVGYLRLATVVSLADKENALFQSEISKQLCLHESLDSNGVNKIGIVPLYQLLCGTPHLDTYDHISMENEVGYRGLTWLRQLGLAVWFQGGRSVTEVLELFNESVRNKKAKVPLARYLLDPTYFPNSQLKEKSDEMSENLSTSKLGEIRSLSLLYKLIGLYAGANRLEECLDPLYFTPNVLDYNLAWGIVHVLGALGYNCPKECVRLISDSFAFSLIEIGRWDFAAYVYLTIEDPVDRKNLVRRLVLRFGHSLVEIEENNEGMEEDAMKESNFVFLTSSLGISSFWFYESAAIRAASNFDYERACRFYIRARMAMEAGQMIGKYLAPPFLWGGLKQMDKLKSLVDECENISQNVDHKAEYKVVVQFIYWSQNSLSEEKSRRLLEKLERMRNERFRSIECRAAYQVMVELIEEWLNWDVKMR